MKNATFATIRDFIASNHTECIGCEAMFTIYINGDDNILRDVLDYEIGFYDAIEDPEMRPSHPKYIRFVAKRVI